MEKTFLQQLVETAQKMGDKVAIVEADGHMLTTYGELLRRARQLASYICTQNITPHSFIAINLSDGSDYVVAELGIWLAKCVSVPMGPTFPQLRMDYIVSHCESPLVVDDDVIAQSAQMLEADIEQLPDIDDDAMLIYTSGSTGNPKGILHTFGTIGDTFRRISDLPIITQDTQFGNYAPMYFVAKVFVYQSLLFGATVHFYSKEVRTDIEKLSDYIADHKISCSYIPPAALMLFKNRSASLQYITTGSEKLTTQHSKDGYTLINNYGMTETFATVTCYTLPHHPMDDVPLGKVVQDIDYVIADEQCNPVPEGEMGELCFRQRLCKEYFKDPEKTSELFRGGLMHTGDLVREVDGLIHYVQRKDWMVKINGQRVEPSEVEAVIRKIDGVKNAVVKGFDSTDGSQYIVGYYILEEDATLTSDDITTHLSKTVPAYMVPRFMVQMEAFPINLNGKIDRMSLQSPELNKTDLSSAQYLAPTNDVERQLCEAMARVLGYKRIGIDDDFLTLGADSIRIMKLQQTCPDLGLNSRLIHTCRTPKAIAASLSSSAISVCKVSEHLHETLPLTQTQLGIYVECEKRQGEAVYNNPFLLRLDNNVDLNNFAQAIEAAVKAHPGLDATILNDADGTPQMKLCERPWPAPLYKIEEVSDTEMEALKPRLQKPFDLRNDRLYRVRIFKTPTAKFVFFDFHHIIFDGTSLHIFLDDVSKAYAGQPLIGETYTAFDVAYTEQQDRQSDVLQHAKDWYKTTFGDTLKVSVPLADLNGKEGSFGHDVFELGMTTHELNEWCAAHGVTANVLTTAAFGKLLSIYTNNDRAIFATIYNGRNDLRTTRTMAMLVKTFPVQIATDNDLTIHDLLDVTNKQMMGAMANDIYSFADLAAETGMTSDVMFVYQGDMHQINDNVNKKQEPNSLSFKLEDLDFNATGERFNVQMMTTADGHLTLDIQYHSHAFSSGYVRRFAQAYNQVLQEMTIREKVSEVASTFSSCREFFASQLKDFDTATEIPADKQGNLAEAKNEEVLATLDIDEVEAFATQFNVTPAAICLAATFYAVARFTNNKQIYLGTTSRGQRKLNHTNIIDKFVNTLPLASHISEQTVEEYIADTAMNLAQTLKQANNSFQMVSSDFGFTPNIMFEYLIRETDQQTMYDQPDPMEMSVADQTTFKVVIKIVDKGVQIIYNDALYSANTMECLARCISATAKSFTQASADMKVKHISMLDSTARLELDSIRQTCIDPEAIRFKLFHESVEYWAEQTPEATALIACNETLTYREFNEKANILAHALIKRGVLPGDRVCLLLPRKSWHLLAMFGVMKTGSAYIPCDPEYPAERIKLITDDSNARYVITTADKISDYGDRALNVEELLTERDESSTANCQLSIPSDSLAYLIYTSGSTGRPKGVMLRHIGICNYLTDHEENRHFHALVNDCKRMLCITTVSFDLSLKEIGASLYNGMTLVFANEDQVTNPMALADLMLTTGVDAFSGTPSRLKMFLDLPEFQRAFSQCKFIVLGGEKYPPTLLPKVKDLAPKARLFNTYGPTEISVSSNGKELTHADRISIGRPLLNVKEYVTDCDLNELPVGVTGELLIGGLGVAAGYNNLPEKTAEAFIDYQGERCYKSGDYAYWNAEGEIIILGRKDHQIKLNGLRIELGEVETVLNKQPQVKECVVMIKNVEDHDHLVAYYTEKESVSTNLLKEQMGKSLTHYMVPTIFMLMDKMPISPNGKTDLKALPDPVVAEHEYVAPVGDVEHFFCDCFASILEREQVGATDNFFEIGGTSLIAMRVVMAAANAGYSIVYKQVFDNPTPRKLAQVAESETTQKGENHKATGSHTAASNTQPDIPSHWDGTDPEVQNYDYTAINTLLAKNTLATFKADEPRRPLGTCIVTGATGYLGIHIVKELIDNPEVTAIYCMVRGSKAMSAESRLRTQLFYYFDNTFDTLLGKRLFVIDGDITSSSCLDALVDIFMDINRTGESTLFNCAANVKHFSAGTDIEDINIKGCQTCIDFCLKTGTRFIQTSTHSIAGTKESDNPCQPDMICETKLFWGQRLDNQYCHAKFIAERNVLEAIVAKGLDAKIVRLGNLSARSTDGEFQINFRTNSFMGRLKAFQTIGCIPYQMAQPSIEFSPIDEVARAVTMLATTSPHCTVFHPVNAHRQIFDNIVFCMNRLGIDIPYVENEDYQKALSQAFNDPAKAPLLQSLMAYQNAPGKYVVNNGDDYEYTTQVLLRLGFRWNFTTWDYMERFITAIQGLGFFDEDYQR